MPVRKAYDVYADSRTVSREKWLELRKSGIGGSEAGAIMGVHPYKGPFGVWADKMGYESAAEDSEAMRQGRDLEEYVARRFAERIGVSVRHEFGMLRSKEHPYMVANIDRRIKNSGGCSRHAAGLECKTSRDIYMKRYRGGDIPMEYYCQCLHYMAVTGWRNWYLAVLVYGTDLLIYKLCREGGGLEYGEEAAGVRRIDVPEDDIDALIAAEESFWREYVERATPPSPDGLKSTTEALGTVYAQSEGYAIDSDFEDDELLAKLTELKAQKKAAEAEIRTIENRIKGRMKEAEELRSPVALVTWRPQKQRRLSERLIKERYPEIDISSVKETVDMRRFVLHTEEEEG